MSSSCLRVGSHGECVWLLHTKHDSIFTSNATIKHTSSDLIPWIRSMQQQQQQQLIYTYRCIDRLCSPVGILRRRHIKTAPSRRGTVYCSITCMIAFPPRYHTSAIIDVMDAVITPRHGHPLCSLAEVRYHSLATIITDNTPSPYHPPRAAGLPCTLLVTGNALDSTHPHNSTPGDHIF